MLRIPDADALIAVASLGFTALSLFLHQPLTAAARLVLASFPAPTLPLAFFFSFCHRVNFDPFHTAPLLQLINRHSLNPMQNARPAPRRQDYLPIWQLGKGVMEGMQVQKIACQGVIARPPSLLDPLVHQLDG